MGCILVHLFKRQGLAVEFVRARNGSLLLIFKKC